LAPLISQRLGKTGINVFTRIMGLILAAIAVEFIANGLKGLFPALAG
jgi:multiple antibiotic resistance protein